MPVQFDPKIHLAYAPPESRITMEELGKAGEGISPIGATQAFPLLTEEAVLALREELFTPRVRERCSFATPRAPCQLRGLSCRPGFAPFNEALWTHPETIRAVSDAVGMELVPIMRYELGHANVQANPGEDTLSKMKREPLRGKVSAVRQESVIPSFENLPSMVADDTDSEDEADLRSPVSQGDKKLEPAIAGHSPPKPNGVELQKEDQHTPVVGWHRDSYPWSCIVMLSDASTMQGGETAVACADKSVKKILGPKMGWAMMVQGRYIDHSALRAYGPERVTMVTSYRAKDVTIPDDSILSPLRAKGHRNEMIYDWATYRLDLLSERFKLESDALKKKRGDGQGPWGEEIVKKAEFKAWCQDQIKYLQTTIDGMD